MGHLPTKMAPEHLDRVQPRTIGRQVQQYQTSRCGTDHCFHFPILMSCEVVPSHKDHSRRMLVQQRLQQLGHFLASLSFADQDNSLSAMIVDGPQPVMHLGLSWGRDPHLLPFGAPHRSQSGQPAHIELVGIVEHLPWLQSVSGFFDLLFFTWYSGSGLLMVCCGRLNTISSLASSRRTVS